MPQVRHVTSSAANIEAACFQGRSPRLQAQYRNVSPISEYRWIRVSWIRSCQAQSAICSKYPVGLMEESGRIRQMLNDVLGNNHVERGIAEWQRVCRA